MESLETINRLNEISKAIIGAAIEVHKILGPGLIESVYEECLKKELDLRGIHYQSQVTFPLIYKGMDTGKVFRIDLLVENEVVVELKAVDELTALNEVQLVTYLKLLNKKLGLLINFNVDRLVNGVRRKVNRL
jgi:GxxExxY protein